MSTAAYASHFRPTELWSSKPVNEFWRVRPLILNPHELDPLHLRTLLAQRGVVIIRNAEQITELVARAGLVPMPQYELVQADDPGKFQLITVPKHAGPGITQVAKPGPTLIHQDGYQFPHKYRGMLIAGNLHMPEVELLHYPKVRELRLIFVYGVSAALQKTGEAGKDLLKALSRPKFRVDIQAYQKLDPFLTEPDPFPVLYKEEFGRRVQIGGRVYGETTASEFALDVFRAYLESTDVHDLRVQSGDAVFTNQYLVAHRGIRPPVDGETVLARWLLRWKR